MVSCDEQPTGRSGLKETSAHVVAWLQLAWHHIAPLRTTVHHTPLKRNAQLGGDGNGGGGDGLRNESSKQQDTKKQPQRVPHAKSKACETMPAVIP